MHTTEEYLERDVDAFIGALSQAQVAVPGGPISGLDWLASSKDPLARQIRLFVLIFANWPYPQAPWAILQPMLRLAIHRMTTGEATEVTPCTYKYGRTGNKVGTSCPNKSVTTNHRCHLHGGK